MTPKSRATLASVPLSTWRIEEARYTNGKPSGDLFVVGDLPGGETIELAFVCRRSGDVSSEGVAEVLREALAAMREVKP